jgi:hypothetical protein
MASEKRLSEVLTKAAPTREKAGALLDACASQGRLEHEFPAVAEAVERDASLRSMKVTAVIETIVVPFVHDLATKMGAAPPPPRKTDDNEDDDAS